METEITQKLHVILIKTTEMKEDFNRYGHPAVVVFDLSVSI